ncbi:hypothetical protein QP415_06255 [Pauljensenia sp. UMB3104]|uniref:hypothetical protein n=1 Tax=Pauljensenia sp. UMB3104 TaxID=3046331 RepID=UPI002550BAEC|nr:hypothetical protein [Pauljensenia sp. UMB3104]MDK7159459.1 hypothetical protein [Pauljensenia sp. UMB3104]
MSENEFDVQRDRAEEDRENVVLTGEEIELPGEDSDASAIIGESSEPIHTGEIESVAIGGLTGRVPAAAPLKPTIEDKISTGELPVVAAPEGDLPVVSTTDEAEAASEETPQVADGGQDDADAPAETANDSEGTHSSDTADEASSEENAQDAPAQTSENAADQQDVSADEEPAASAADEESETGQADAESAHSTDEGAEASGQDDATSADATPEAEDSSDETDTPEEPEPTRTPVMTPAQAAAALGLNLDDAVTKAEKPTDAEEHAEATEPTGAADSAVDSTEESKDADEAKEADEAGETTSAVGGAAAEHPLTSRRSMIFGDDEETTPSIPTLAPTSQAAPASSEETDAASAEVDQPAADPTPFTEPTAQLPTQHAQASYSFEDQDAAEEARPRRRSLLGEGNEDAEAATLAAIASTAARGDKSDSGRLDDELFSAAPQVTEMPSRTGAHWLSLLLFLILTPVGWYLAADAGARMTLADAAPMYTGVASMLALGELLGSILIAAILFMVARRSSLGAWLMGLGTLIVGLPWVMAPGITATSALAALTALTNTGSLGANLSHHLQASGYSGRFVLLGVALLGLAYVSHAARRTGRDEEALRTSIEATNPAGAFYSKRARKKAAKDAARK